MVSFSIEFLEGHLLNPDLILHFYLQFLDLFDDEVFFNSIIFFDWAFHYSLSPLSQSHHLRNLNLCFDYFLYHQATTNFIDEIVARVSNSIAFSFVFLSCHGLVIGRESLYFVVLE